METLFPNIHRVMEKRVFDGSLLMHWKSKYPDKPAIILMAHQDVVPASEDGWKYPPFSGTIAEGKIWGRGAVDCKSRMFLEWSAVEELIEEGFDPPCDIWLEASANEEITGTGAIVCSDYLKDNNVSVAFVLDEGGTIAPGLFPGFRGVLATIGVCEKGYMDVKISASVKGAHEAHSSTPPRGTPLARLAMFVTEVERKRPFKKQLSREVRDMFNIMAPYMSFKMRFLLCNLWLFKPLALSILDKMPFGAALIHTTCCFTRFQGSDANNVIPQSAYVVANLRPSQHQNCEQSLTVLRRIADKYDLDLEVLHSQDATRPADIDGREYRYIAQCIRVLNPDVCVIPFLVMGGSDCRRFKQLTDQAMLFCPYRTTKEEINACHGLNEHATIDEFAPAVDFYKYVLSHYEPA